MQLFIHCLFLAPHPHLIFEVDLKDCKSVTSSAEGHRASPDTNTLARAETKALRKSLRQNFHGELNVGACGKSLRTASQSDHWEATFEV